MMDSPIITIIIPVYNAANLLDRCLSSIKEQSYDLLEVIFIDDCSEDSSFDILIQFGEVLKLSKPNVVVKILRHDENKGVAEARNTGLNAATGEYIYYLDADDYLANNGIELLVKRAMSTNADITGSNWVLQFEKNGRKMIQPVPNSPSDAIELMAKGLMRWNLWLFLVKRCVYEDHNVRFLSGKNMGEDMMVMFKLLLHARDIVMIQEPIYFYSQSNAISLTKVYSEKHRHEVECNLKEVNRYYLIFNKVNDWGCLFNFLKLNIKLPLLISNYKQNYQEWYYWFSEANVYSFKNSMISIRIRLLQYMASKKQYWFLKLHYYFVVKFVYGVIYK